MQHQPDHRAPARALAGRLDLSPRAKLLLMIGGGIAALLLLAIVALNVLLSANWVRDRIAAHIREVSGRELKVDGTTALLFRPSPRVVITDATLTDPEARAGTADIAIGQLIVDLSFGQLFGRGLDAKRIDLIRPVVKLRLGSDGDRAAPVRTADKAMAAPAAKPAIDSEKKRRELSLDDVRIKDGTVVVLYDAKGTERRVEHIRAKLHLPSLTEAFTGVGKFDWKGQTVKFGLELNAPADLKAARPAKMLLALDTPALALRFNGNVVTRPGLSGEGELSAKAQSIPSLLAWMRETPPASTAIGDGELASQVAWKAGEISFSRVRFALEHASGQGQAVVTLHSPRPHVRAALAFDHLDLNPFLAGGSKQAAAVAQSQSQAAKPASADKAAAPTSSTDIDAALADDPDDEAGTDSAGTPPAPAANGASPAAFDADVNLNVRKMRVGHLDLGPSSYGFVFRDGVLNATLGGMELYDGHGSGQLTLDVTQAVPAFRGDFRLDGVQARPFLSDAAQVSLISGRTKLALQLSGTGTTAEAIKASLSGQGTIALSDGDIEGVDITSFISEIGAGEIPELRKGPGAKTAFSDLGGSFTIADGVAETGNLQMLSPLLKVTAAGSVDLKQDSIDMLARPEIVAGPQGKGGANDLAGLSVPVRIEGSLQNPNMKPELKGMFASPDQAGKTINQIGAALQKKFKGKPVGEAIGRFLGNVQIETRGNGEADAEAAPPQEKPQRSGKAKPSKAQPKTGPETEQGDSAEPDDPDLDRILQ
jgi:AsmA protein